MSLRPDLIECWVFRVAPPADATDPRPDADRLEILLIRRAPSRIFPGLWQCVTGGVEPGERVWLPLDLSRSGDLVLIGCSSYTSASVWLV